MEESFSIIVWTDRYNSNGKITRSRLLIMLGNKYYEVEGDKSVDVNARHILINIEVAEVYDIENYKIKGRNYFPFSDIHRSTEVNIEIYRIRSDVEQALIAWIHGSRSWVAPDPIYDGIRHSEIVIYGDINDVDTVSELNASVCSRDTYANIIQDTCLELNIDLGLIDHINATEKSIQLEINEIIYAHRNSIYSDIVAYRKALERYPERQQELTRIHITKWTNSTYYNQIVCALGWGG